MFFDGDNHVYLAGYDQAPGNSELTFYAFEAQISRLEINITSPTDGATYYQNWVYLNFTVDQNTSVVAYLDGNEVYNNTNYTANTTVSLRLENLTHGSHTITVNATYSNNKTVSESVTFNTVKYEILNYTVLNETYETKENNYTLWIKTYADVSSLNVSFEYNNATTQRNFSILSYNFLDDEDHVYDFGKIVYIEDVHFHSICQDSIEWDIKVSTDGTNWTTVHYEYHPVVYCPPESTVESHTIRVGMPARYLKVYISNDPEDEENVTYTDTTFISPAPLITNGTSLNLTYNYSVEIAFSDGEIINWTSGDLSQTVNLVYSLIGTVHRPSHLQGNTTDFLSKENIVFGGIVKDYGFNPNVSYEILINATYNNSSTHLVCYNVVKTGSDYKRLECQDTEFVNHGNSSKTLSVEYKLQITFQNTTVIRNTTVEDYKVWPIYLVSGGNAVKFTFWNESTGVQINSGCHAQIAVNNIKYKYSDDTYLKQEFSFESCTCYISPLLKSRTVDGQTKYLIYYADVDVIAGATNFTSRTFSFQNVTILENDPKEIHLWLIEQKKSVPVQIKVIYDSGTSVEGALVILERWVGNKYETVTSGYTDSEGKVYLQVVPYDVYYNIKVSLNGQVVKEESKIVFSPNQLKYVVISTGEETYFTFLSEINANCELNGTIVKCFATDTTDSIRNFRFYVYSISHLGRTLLENETVASKSVTFVRNASKYSGPRLIFEVAVVYEGREYVLAYVTYEKGGTTQFGTFGYVLLLLATMICVGLVRVNYVFALGMLVLIMVVLSVAGFVSITTGAIVAMGVLIGIIMWRFGK